MEHLQDCLLVVASLELSWHCLLEVADMEHGQDEHRRLEKTSTQHMLTAHSCPQDELATLGWMGRLSPWFFPCQFFSLLSTGWFGGHGSSSDYSITSSITGSANIIERSSNFASPSSMNAAAKLLSYKFDEEVNQCMRKLNNSEYCLQNDHNIVLKLTLKISFQTVFSAVTTLVVGSYFTPSMLNIHLNVEYRRSRFCTLLTHYLYEKSCSQSQHT